jgi:hypothetical protein
MYTAEIIRRQQMEAHWRLYEHQLRIVEAMKPVAEQWGRLMREAYPELAAPVPNGMRETHGGERA